MLLTIHNLPTRTQYSDVKDLIISECGLIESILDNLQNEGSGMRVTVGVAEKKDAAILVRKINGLNYRGQRLFVEDKRLRKESEQPFCTSTSQQPQYKEKAPAQQSLGFNPHFQAALNMYQPVDNYAGYQHQNPVQTGGQNTYMAYGGQQTQPQQLLSQFTGAFNEFVQQPYVPTVQQNPEPAVLYTHRSPSLERHWSTEVSVGSECDGRLRGGSPPAFAPWASHGQDQPPQLNDYQDPRGVRNERPEHSGGFGHPKEIYEKRGPRHHDDSRGFNASNTRGGHFSNPRDMRGEHSSNSRDVHGGQSSMSRDMRGGHSSNSRDIHGGQSSMSRDMRGGHSSNSRDIHGGQSSMSRDMRGGHSSNSRDIHGGQSSTSRHMRGGHTSNSRDIHGGQSSMSRDMRGGHSSISRAMRGGYGPHAHESRGEPTPNPREKCGDNSPNMPDNCPKNARKRRWDEPTDQFKRDFDRPTPDNWREQPITQRQSRPLHREEPQPMKFAPQPPRDFDVNNAGLVSNPQGGHNTAKLTKKTIKALKASLIKGVGKIMFIVATHLNIVNEFEGRSLLKSQIRKIINGRVTDMLTGVISPLSPDEIVARYRARYPEIDDFNIYKSVTHIHAADAGPETIMEEIKQQQEKGMEACEISATMQRAIEEEVDLICALLENLFKTPECQEERLIFSEIDQEECLKQCKKLVTFHAGRRITNSGLKQVKILARPRAPRRPFIAAFMSQYRCLTLKKSKRNPSYLATFNSYETVDQLCTMKTAEIGFPKVQLIFHYVGVVPNKKVLYQSRAKSDRKKYVLRLIQNSKVNLLDKNWRIIEEEERKAKVDSDSDDVVFLGRQGVTEIEITDDEEPETKPKVSAAEDRHDVSHVDLKLIDKVKESDNDKVPHEGDRRLIDKNEKIEVKDDWDETEEIWDDIGDKRNERNTGENDAKFDYNAELNNFGDVYWDDVDEDDLEDYL